MCNFIIRQNDRQVFFVAIAAAAATAASAVFPQERIGHARLMWKTKRFVVWHLRPGSIFTYSINCNVAYLNVLYH